MIALCRIQTSDTENYHYLEELMGTSFPKNERRDFSLQRILTDESQLFFNHVILDGAEPVGLISYWDFVDFVFIEHFAIEEAKRNQGYGQAVIEMLQASLMRPIVLEVEPPDNEMSRRRIGFYRRFGFQLWERDYRQPPYRIGEVFLPMFLMAWGILEDENCFDRIKSVVYREVYGIVV